MSIYTSGYETIWKQFALDIGAEHIEGKYGASDQIIATVGPWKIQFDTYTARAVADIWSYERSYTRAKAFFHSQDGLSFQIQRKSSVGLISRLLGSKIKVGIPEFDQEFMLQGNSPDKLAMLFCSPGIRSQLEQLEDEKIEILMKEGPWREQFPEGASVLYFNTVGVMTDMARLSGLKRLFVELLNGMSAMGSAAPTN